MIPWKSCAKIYLGQQEPEISPRLLYFTLFWNESIFILVEQKIFFCRIIWPYIFNGLIDFTFVFNFL